MEDRELLERAAKAAGMEHMRWSGPLGLVRMLDPSRPEATGSIGAYWNPLTDDGDALRLAVKLRLTIDHGSDWAVALKAATATEFCEDLGDHANPYAATCRAIVRAAASLPEPPKEETT